MNKNDKTADVAQGDWTLKDKHFLLFLEESCKFTIVEN